MTATVLIAIDMAWADIAPAVPDPEFLHQPFGEEDVTAFRKPPREYAPETWFHFIGGNVAKAGITADLEAIAAAGIQGIQLFHGQFGGPWPGVEPQIKCLSESWDEAVAHVARECRRLGLRFTMQNCPGWAMAGGPWIPPEKAMRHLVWSRVDFTGDGTKAMVLAQPQPSGEPWRDYRDIAVIAFPTPEGDTGVPLTPAEIRSNRGDLPWDKCLRREKEGEIHLNPGDEPAWLEVTFPEETVLRTLELPSAEGMSHAWCYDPDVTVTVEALLEQGNVEVLREAIPQSNWQGKFPLSLACSEVPARTYRITIDPRHPITLKHMRLFSAARKNNWEAEAAWLLGGLMRSPHPRQSSAAWLKGGEILDLTGRMDVQGNLDWQVPEGRWTVLRFGHVNAGKRNGPAPPEATGWECDKLSRRGADIHFPAYIGRISGPDGPAAGGLLEGMVLDSWECESQTWTPDMPQEFSTRRGYGLALWLPALIGYVVDSPEKTACFLRDWRVTVNDLLVQNFFGRMAELGHARGLLISFETASGDTFPGDILEYYKHADVPMCEFWHPRTEAFVGSFEFKPVKPCVAAARMYGKPRVAAEAFTSFTLSWTEHPGMLKPIADMHMAEGVTHMIFHTFTHQPRTDFLPPGSAFGARIGTPFLRNQTWWRHMPAFTAYLARCGYLLERGLPVADVLWYVGDEQDHKPRQGTPFPEGYRYDYCNPDVLLNRLSVQNGRIITPEGIAYALIWLPECPRMCPETLERLLVLARRGAVILGDPPRGPATLTGGAEAESRFERAVMELWGKSGTAAGNTGAQDRVVGQGRVLSGMSPAEALDLLGMRPDVEGAGDHLVWSHRQTEGADWYFVAAPGARGFRGTLGFRASGRVELWNPVTGTALPAALVRHRKNGSLVALDLPPGESLFVVFRRDSAESAPSTIRLEHNGKVIADVESLHATVIGPVAVSAQYGDPKNPDRCMDVTAQVRRDLAGGATSISPNNSWAGGDPARGTRKCCRVTLRRMDGTEIRCEGWEGGAVSLLDTTPVPGPVCQLLDGGRWLLAWEPGIYRAVCEDGSGIQCSASTAKIDLNSAWDLAFPKGWGSPETLHLETLEPWCELSLSDEARSFSGTALYTTEFTIDKVDDSYRFELDLGVVGVIARVFLNDTPVGTTWTPPHRLDISDAVSPGRNRLAVEITNTWHNRLAYDAGLPEEARKTWTIGAPEKGAPLLKEGLLGPVCIRIGRLLDLE